MQQSIDIDVSCIKELIKMKNKFLTLLLISLTCIGKLGAQNISPSSLNRGIESEDAFNVISSIIVLVVVLVFIISMVRQLFENKIKNKIIDKGISDSQISAILQPKSGDGNYVNIKWCILLTGLGIGLTIINYTLPLGIHSLAIISFSMAISFIAYHYFLQKMKKL